MKLLPLRKRDICHGGLSLAELIAVALCGSIAFFTVVGLLMAWRIKIRQKRAPTRVYAISDEFFQTRLTKCPLSMSESAMSGLSNFSRLPLKPSSNQQLPLRSSKSTSNFLRTLSRRRVVRKRWAVGGNFHVVPANKHKSQNGSPYEDYFTQKQPEEEYYRGAYQFHNHGPHYQQKQMIHLNGHTAIIQRRIQSTDGSDVELPPWGRGWRVPDKCHKI